MDSANVSSNASTIVPSDSASQMATATKPTQSKAPKPKRPSKGAIDKDAPPGAVQVPVGVKSSAPASKVVSATIPLSGWGNIDLSPHRKDIEPTFTTDARPYADMVDTVYMSIQSRYTTGGKHIPRSLFRYYCLVMWWYRALWLFKSNGNVLNTEQKNFLSILSQMEELQLPSHVAQYLANMGNFLQGGEQYYFRLPFHKFVTSGTGAVKEGWLETADPDGQSVTDAEFWTYAQIPVPAVYAVTICNEADLAVGGPADNNLDVALPAAPDGVTVYPTDNIIGWNNNTVLPAHTSWRSTFSQLGWSLNSMPADTQTQFNVSTSTLKWVSDRLSTLKDFKVNGIKQLSLSTQGHPMLAYYLGTETPATQKSQFPPVSEIMVNSLCASRFSELAVKSRFSIDAKVLAPAFSFGYRIERSLMFDNYKRGVPQYHSRSNYQPWVAVKGEGAERKYLPLSSAQQAGMNSTLNYGSSPFLNSARFATHELHRSTGLDAALILSDVK